MTTVVQLIPDTREIVVVLSQSGGLSADQIAAITGADSPNADNPFATMAIMVGFDKFERVAELPVTWETDTIYLVPA